MSARLAARRVRWPLRRPIVVAGRALDDRVVLDLRVTDERGRVGVGEAAPLPGLHRETLDDLDALLPAAARALAAALADAGRAAEATLAAGEYLATLDALARDAAWTTLPPSLRCGLESALLDLRAAGGDAARAIAPGAGPPLAPCALVDGSPDDLPAGCRCAKVKVGRRGEAEDLALVAEVRRRGGADLELRLDANRAWSLAAALDFARAVAPLRPAWYEEPVAAADLPAFLARSGARVALDETLREGPPLALAHAAGVAAWVLKPSLLGIGGTLAAFTQAQGIPCVVSASFESPRGLAPLAALARVAPGRPAPGLGTAAWFTGAHEPLQEWRDVVA